MDTDALPGISQQYWVVLHGLPSLFRSHCTAEDVRRRSKLLPLLPPGFSTSWHAFSFIYSLRRPLVEMNYTNDEA